MRYDVRALACGMLLMQCYALVGITTEQDQTLTQIITDFTQTYSSADQTLTQTVSGFFAYLDAQSARVAQSTILDSDKTTLLSLIATSSKTVSSSYSTNKASLDTKYQTAYTKLVTTKAQWVPKVTSSISFTEAQSALNLIVKAVNFQAEVANVSSAVGDQISYITTNVVNKLPKQTLDQVLAVVTQAYTLADQTLTQTVAGFFAYVDAQSALVAQSTIADSDKTNFTSLVKTSSSAVSGSYSTNKASLDTKYQTALAAANQTKSVPSFNFQIEVANVSSEVQKQISAISGSASLKLAGQMISQPVSITQEQIDDALNQIIIDFTQNYSGADQALTQTVSGFFDYLESRSVLIFESAILDSEKATFYDWAQTSSLAVSSSYSTNKGSLDTKYQTAYTNLVAKKDQLAPTITSSILLAGAQSNLNTIVNAVDFQIEIANVSKTISDELSDLSGTGVIALANAELVAKQVYQQQMFKMWTALQVQVTPYQQIKQDAQSFEISHVTSKTFDASTFDSLVTRLKTVITALISIYGSYKVTIDFNDLSNFAVSAAKYFINLCGDDMNVEQSIATSETAVLGTKDAGFARLYALCTRILGTQNAQDPTVISQGYNATMSDIAALFSSDVGEQLISTYTTQRKIIIQSTVIDALQDLLTTYSAPTTQQIEYGQAFVDVAILDVAPDDTATISKLYTSIATLYVNRALNILKNLLPGDDNTAAVNDAVTDFQNAAAQYSKAGDQDSSNKYTALATNLSNGLTSLVQAQQPDLDVTKAIEFYQQAASYFTNGGDPADSGFCTIEWTKLDSQNMISQAQTKFTDALSSNSITLQTYLRLISGIDPITSTQQQDFYTAWNALVAASLQAISFYDNAVKDFADIAVSVQVSADTSYQEAQYGVEQAVIFINTFTSMWDVIMQGDKAAQGDITSLDGIDIAENLYEVAINQARRLDALYTKFPTMSQYVPLYVTDLIGNVTSILDLLETGQVWNYETMVVRHISKNYINIMMANEDEVVPLISAQYFSDADGGRRKYITSTVDTYLTTTLSSIRSYWGNIESVYFNAQAEENKAKNFTVSDWKNVSTDPRVYSSTANDQWQDILRHYKTGVLLGSPDVTNFVNASQQGYINAAGEYAAQYLQYVSSDYFPELTEAMIYYRQYCMYVLNSLPGNQGSFSVIAGGTELEQQTFTTIGTLIKQFFSEGSDLIEKTKDTSLVATATENQKRLVEWKDYFDQVLYEQQDILNQFFSDDQMGQYTLLGKEVDDAGNITCIWLPDKTKVVVPNPDRALAQTYKNLGDTAFNALDYKTAYQDYYQAWQSYTAIGDITDAQAAFSEYIISRVRSLASYYANSVVPNDQDPLQIPTRQFYSASVPTLYELTLYEVPLSSAIPLPSNLSYLATATTADALSAIENDLIGLASLVYMDLSLQSQGFSYNDVFDGLTVRSPLPSNISVDVVNNILAQAQAYSDDLTERLNSKLSSIYLINYEGTYLLAQTYMPIPATETPTDITSGITLKVSPYSNFPTAEMYFGTAQLFYAPGQYQVPLDGSAVAIASEDQDVDAKTALYNRLAQAYIQDASDYGLITDYIMTDNTVDTLKTIVGLADTTAITALKTSYQQVAQITDKTDTSNILSDYRSTYQSLKSYYLDLIFPRLAYAQDYLTQGKSTNAETFKAQIATMLTDAASKLKAFLFGDPLSDDYYLNLKDQTDMVKMVLAYAPSQEEKLYTYLAQLSLDAGNSLVASKKYASAVGFYLNALAAYQMISKPSAQTLFAIDQATIQAGRALVTAAAVNLGAYQKAKSDGIVVSGKTVSFQQLLKDFQQLGKPSVLNYGTGMSSDELIIYKNLKSSLLDAIIDCMGASSQLDKMVTNAEDPTTQSAALGIIATYTQQAGIDLSSATGVTAFLTSDDLQSLIINGFEDAVKSISSSSSQEANDSSFAAAARWCDTITELFDTVYINDYLGGASTSDQWSAFSSALNAEVQDILSPASSYVGGNTSFSESS